MRRKPSRTPLCAALLLFICTSCPARAGIAEFNKARIIGDFAGAAEETEGIWATCDKNSDSARVVAAEFAFVNFRAGRYKDAQRFIDRLEDEVNPLPEAREESAAHRVLSKLVRYRLTPSARARDELEESITTRLKEPDWDEITLTAANALLQDDWENVHLDDLAHTAPLLTDVAARAGDGAIAYRRKGELLTIVGAFLRHGRKEHYDQMADLHDRILNDIDAANQETLRVALAQLMWTTHAWINAIKSTLLSGGSRVDPGHFAESDFRWFSYPRHSLIFWREEPDDPDPRPLCALEFTHDKLRYPLRALRKGSLGSVILVVDFDDNGLASNARVLASIPNDLFGKAMLEIVPTFVRKPLPGQDRSACRLSERDVIVPGVFYIE